jgi:hypothetical protein
LNGFGWWINVAGRSKEDYNPPESPFYKGGTEEFPHFLNGELKGIKKLKYNPPGSPFFKGGIKKTKPPFLKGDQRGIKQDYAILQQKPKRLFQNAQKEYDRCRKTPLVKNKKKTTEGLSVLQTKNHRQLYRRFLLS